MTVVRETIAPPRSQNTAGSPSGAGLMTWLIVGLLFLATLINYLDRQTISVLATRIADDPAMRLTDAHLGQIFFAFLLAYGIAQLLIGPLLDRFPVRYAYPIAVTAWSLAGAAAALATGFWSLFGLRMLLGICESPNWPLALRVVSRTIPPNQRTLASGIFQCGTSVGALIAPPIIVWLTPANNWRFAFVAVGAIGLVWAALWLVFFAIFPTARLDSDEPAGNILGAGLPTPKLVAGLPTPPLTASPVSLAEIFGSPVFWSLFVATSFLNPLQYFYTTWLPRYFEKYAGVPFGAALAHRLVIVYLALDVGLILGGVAVAWLATGMTVSAARRLVAAVGALCMATIPLVAWLSSLNLVTAVVCTATFGLGSFMVNYLACTSEVSARKVSTAAGLLGGTGSLAGAVFMWLVGDLVTRTGSFSIAFIVAGLMPLVALGGLWMATRASSVSNP
jgi:MFS transporter, ACS family, hexuronate transporter